MKIQPLKDTAMSSDALDERLVQPAIGANVTRLVDLIRIVSRSQPNAPQ